MLYTESFGSVCEALRGVPAARAATGPRASKFELPYNCAGTLLPAQELGKECRVSKLKCYYLPAAIYQELRHKGSA